MRLMRMREGLVPNSWQEVIELDRALQFLNFQNQQHGTDFGCPDRPKHVPNGMRSHDFDCVDACTGRFIALEIAGLIDSEEQTRANQFFLDLLGHLKRTLDGSLPGDFSIQVESPITLRAKERSNVWNNLSEMILEEAEKLEVGGWATLATPVRCLLHRLTEHGSRLTGIWHVVQSTDARRRHARAFFQSLVADKNGQFCLARSRGQETFLLLDKTSQTYDMQFIKTLLDEMQSELYSNIDHFFLLSIGRIEEIVPSSRLNGGSRLVRSGAQSAHKRAYKS